MHKMITGIVSELGLVCLTQLGWKHRCDEWWYRSHNRKAGIGSIDKQVNFYLELLVPSQKRKKFT